MSSSPIVLYCLIAFLYLHDAALGKVPIRQTDEDAAMFNKQLEAEKLEFFSTGSNQVFVIINEFLVSYFKEVENETCGADWSSLHEQQQELKILGKVKIPLPKQFIAIDAFGKPGAGFFRNNVKYMGNFDECMNIETKGLDFTMQYCFLSVTLSTFIGTTPVSFDLTEALCIPTSCTMDDLDQFLPIINAAVQKYHVSLKFNGINTCTAQGDDKKYSAGSVIMILVCFLFLGLSLGATGIDTLMQYYPSYGLGMFNGIINDATNKGIKNSETQPLLPEAKPNRFHVFLYDVVKGFSLYTTVPAVLSTKQPPTAIACINGIRVISMFWVILCHTYFFFFIIQNFSNLYDVLSSFVTRYSAQPILNGYFSVDSFFFLSGVLVAYLTFRQMERKKGSFPFLPYYIHRFFRLTPTYMFVLFFTWFVAIRLGSGPLIHSAFGEGSNEIRKCRDHWWTNLLYINNFYPREFGEQCISWTWYLANDMQFYVISPLLLIPLYYWVPSGLIAIILTLVASFGVTGFIAGYYEYPASEFWPIISQTTPPPGQPDQSSQIYGKPYCRIAPYLVGILLGYILYKKYRIPVKKGLLGWIIHLVIWAIAAVLGMVNVYAFYPIWQGEGHGFTEAGNVSYFIFSRFTWGVTLFLVVFVCHNGYGGFINSFLSLPVWIPLSRFTFNAYLLHEMIGVLMLSQLRTTVYYNDSSFIFYVIGLVALSFGAAAVVTVFVEFPISNLEAALFKLAGAPLRSSTRIANRDEKVQASIGSTETSFEPDTPKYIAEPKNKY